MLGVRYAGAVLAAALAAAGGAGAAERPACGAPGAWARSADAAWLHRAATAAGYRVTGCTGSAWTVRASALRLAAWTTRGPAAGGRVYRPLAGRVVVREGRRLRWRAQGRTVWVESPGPPDRLQGRSVLAWLVLATLRLPRVAAPVRFGPAPPAVLARCRSDPLVRAACPTRLPRIPGWNLYPRAGLRGIFGVERGGEAPGRPELNRPPALFHLELARGLRPWVAWRWPAGPVVAQRDGLLRRRRAEPLLLGRVTWGGRAGELALAPAYPAGGSQGSHLVFRWRRGGAEYVLGLHAWEPLTEAVAALRRIAASIPRRG